MCRLLDRPTATLSCHAALEPKVLVANADALRSTVLDHRSYTPRQGRNRKHGKRVG